MQTGYIKNPAGYYLIMVAVIVSCIVASYYHWSLVVIDLISLRINITTVTIYYSLVIFAGFPIIYWVAGTRNARQFSISNQVKNIGKAEASKLLKRIFGRSLSRKQIKMKVKGDASYHRILTVLLLIAVWCLMVYFQYYVLSTVVHWRKNIELWRVLAWDSGLASVNAIIVVILSSVAYKLKSRRIPANYIQKT